MKKVLSLMIILSFIFLCVGCQNTKKEQGTNETQTKEETSTQESTEIKKSLVIYFSWSGNTEKVAKEIQKQTNSDLFKIEAARPYSDDYDTVVDLAKQEQNEKARPRIANQIQNIDDYDTLYIGYPNWWGDMPMIMYTFFETYDLSNKTIAPFCTSGGSGLSNTVNEIKGLEPDATVSEGLHIRDSSASNPENDVSTWLDKIGNS